MTDPDQMTLADAITAEADELRAELAETKAALERSSKLCLKIWAENDELRAHIKANCRLCNGTGFSGGSGGTHPARIEMWLCNHGLARP